SPFSTTSTRAISRTSLQPASSFTYPLLQALSTSKSIASPQSSCCLMHLWPLLAQRGNSSSRIIGRGATLFARLTTRPPPPTEHPHNELSGDQLRQKVQIVRRTVAAKSHSRNVLLTQSGHEPLSNLPLNSLRWDVPHREGDNEAARVHQANRLVSGLAACCGRATCE